jgi:ferric-dicitrate binding protein FerR (iron transport regulator)
LVIHDKTLNEVAAILSTVFDKNIEVSPTVSTCRMSAKIEYETITDVLNIIKETLGVEWKNEPKRIFIYGKGC